MKQSMKARESLLILAMLIFAISGLFSTTISGQVLNPNDEAISQGNIFLMNVSNTSHTHTNHLYQQIIYSWDALVNNPTLIQTITNENGIYNFENVPNGSYIVFANSSMYYQTPHMIDGEIFVITVDADDVEVSDINIKMVNISELGSVSGYVYNTEGQAVESAFLTLVHENNSNIIHSYSVSSNENGFYEKKFIISGNYRIAVYDYMNAFEPVAFSEAFTVSADNLHNTNINIYNVDLQGFTYGQGSVSGTVYDINNQPMSSQRLQLINTNSNTPAIEIGESFPTGEYQSTDFLANGTYQVALISTYTQVPVAYSEVFEITEENQAVTNIDIILDFDAISVSGHVYSPGETNQLFPFVNLVTFYNGQLTTITSTLMDENGFFNFQNIEAGEYYLSGSYNNCSYFYPGVLDISQAQVIYVENQSLGNINVTIPAFEVFTISGTVTCETTGEPIQNALVRAISPDSWFTSYSKLTNANGSYSITLPQGEYRLSAHSTQGDYIIQFYDQAIDPLSSSIININSNISNINFNLTPLPVNNNYFVSGTVTIEGEAPLTNIMVVAVSSDEDWETTTTTDIYGNYTLPVVYPGNYYILAIEPSSPPTFFPNAHYWETAEAVSVNGHVHNININMENVINYGANGTNTISGNVSSSLENEIISNAGIIIKNTSGQTIGFSNTSQNGQYVVNNLPDDEIEIIVTKIRYNSIVENTTIDGNIIIDYVLTPYVTSDADETTPELIALKISNYPNPFNPTTTIAFSLQNKESVSLEIFNVKGQKVKTLLKNEILTGNQKILWNGKDNHGNNVGSGIYFSRIKTESETAVGKMVLIK